MVCWSERFQLIIFMNRQSALLLPRKWWQRRAKRFLDTLCIFRIYRCCRNKRWKPGKRKVLRKHVVPSRDRVLRGRARLNLTGMDGGGSGVHDEKYSRECHLRFVLSRLKCILKGNRERRCNFPRETEHEIKRGCRTAAAHSPPLPSPRSPALHSCCTIRLSDTSGFILPFGCPRRSSTRVLTIIFPGEAQHPLPHFPLSLTPFPAYNPRYAICGGTGEAFQAISRRWVLKIKKNARRENCVSSSIFFKRAERVHWPRNALFSRGTHAGICGESLNNSINLFHKI